jgi:hypothetical protein
MYTGIAPSTGSRAASDAVTASGPNNATVPWVADATVPWVAGVTPWVADATVPWVADVTGLCLGTDPKALAGNFVDACKHRKYSTSP